MQFPDLLQIQLVSSPQGAVSVGAVLVALEVRTQGRYYFGTVLGLSDPAGRVQLSRSALEDDFTENQRLFLMDYRLPLCACDSEVAIRVQGGEVFVEAQRAAERNDLVPPEVRQLWRAARNEVLADSLVQIDLREHSPERVSVRVPISAAVSVRPHA